MKILNLAIHQLTQTQLDQLDADHNDIVDVRNIANVDAELALELANTPDNADELNALAERVHALLRSEQYTAVHLPCGSPAFMFALATYDEIDFRISYIFSHSNRVSNETTDADGVVYKVSEFRFQKFIYF